MRFVDGLLEQRSRCPRSGWLLGCALSLVACQQQSSEPAPATSISAAAAGAPELASAAPSASTGAAQDAGSLDAGAAKPAPPSAPDPKRYAWLGNETLKQPPAVTTLSQRFPPPPSYTRLPVEAGSFGEWLRDLPLAAPGTPVLNYKGEQVQAGSDQYLGAVVAMDTSELQTSTDLVIRLNAEWKYSQGTDVVFKSATGIDLPFARWLLGDRLKANGAAVNWIRNAKPAERSHAALRAYLEGVFTWANSTSLIASASPVAPSDIRPGDFLIHSGKPNHAVVLLDIARNPKGKLVALLGRALSPAQSFHVLGLGLGETWYNIDPHSESLLTPGTASFPWSSARRLR